MRESLWTFSCQFYQQPTIQELLLELQDKHSLNVNMLLALIYLAHHNESLTPEQIAEYTERTQVISAKIAHLRQVRREFADPDPEAPFAETYALLKQAELSAEKVMLKVLERLFEQVPPKVDQQDAYSDNLQAYWSLVSNEAMPKPLQLLLRQAPLFAKTG